MKKRKVDKKEMAYICSGGGAIMQPMPQKLMVVRQRVRGQEGREGRKVCLLYISHRALPKQATKPRTATHGAIVV